MALVIYNDIRGAQSMKTVLVCGSKCLTGEINKKVAIAHGLGQHIVLAPGYRLLTGGAKGHCEGESGGGVDYSAAKGAQDALPTAEVASKILTIHPRRREQDELFTIGSVVLSRGRNTAARRFDLVARADAVITIEGETGTPKIIDYSIASGKPVISIACTGGASAEAWNDETNRQAFFHTLGLSEEAPEFEILHHGLATPQLVVDACVDLLNRVLRPRCFVIMPFSEEHSEPLYEHMLRKTLDSEGYETFRADSIHGSRPIMDDIVDQIGQADLILADISGNNPNVMFELGLAIAQGKRVIILCRKEPNDRLDDLVPFDLQTLRVLPFSFLEQEEFREELRAWIRS